MKQKIINCYVCKGNTVHIVSSINHILHLILSIITGGLWIPIWILLGIISMFKTDQCLVCASNPKPLKYPNGSPEKYGYLKPGVNGN